jgi:uncharacterized protein (TIGR03435 family)
MNKKLLALGLSIFCLLSLPVMTNVRANQSTNLQPGAAAPELGLEKLLQAPAGSQADLASLRGKVVVVEFWATWCAPCIAVQPHLNQLAEQFKDKPVQFISLTDEEEAIVAPFLARRTLKGWVGLDLDRSVHQAYGISGIPKTIVIDQTGKIATITRANQLNEEMLNQLLAGTYKVASPKLTDQPATPANKVSIGGPNLAPNETKASETEPALFELSIKPSNASMTMIGSGPKRLTASGAELKSILSGLLRTSPSRISVPAELLGKRFDLKAVLQNNKTEGFNPLIVSALENALGIKIKRVTRELDAYVLTAPKELTGSLQPTKAKSFHLSSDKGVLAAAAAEPGRLAAAIEGVIETPVLDETKLQGKFDWDLLYDSSNPKSIIEAIRKELGLEIGLAKRPVETVLVEKQ